MWSTRRLNDMDACPPIRYASGADGTGYPRPGDPPVSGPGPGEPSRSEARRRHVCLIQSLGICLPCQVMPADLRLACTSAYRS
jgi:hypothetical protein